MRKFKKNVKCIHSPPPKLNMLDINLVSRTSKIYNNNNILRYDVQTIRFLLYSARAVATTIRSTMSVQI